MRKIILFSFIALLVGLLSCKEEESWISMTALENAVLREVNAFRADSGMAPVTANYDTMVEQAKKYSAFLATGNEDPDGTELQAIWDIIHDRWGGTNEVAVVSLTRNGTGIYVEDIIEPLKAQDDTAEALLEDVTIGGVGIAYDPNGNAHTTILMMRTE
ncbi:MAG: hypothetical protein JXR52_07550 [Bacteroidales bacterium]|nr:hypothetical protein [Bacteroidales bacterium]